MSAGVTLYGPPGWPALVDVTHLVIDDDNIRDGADIQQAKVAGLVAELAARGTVAAGLDVVRDFGAVPGDEDSDYNLLPDSTDAFAAWLTELASQRMKGGSADGLPGGSATSGSLPLGWVPLGAYKVLEPLAIPAWARLWTEGAILYAPDPLVDIFDIGAAFENVISGFRFRGGGRGVHIHTGNVNSARVTLEDCDWNGQAVASTEMDSTSASTILTITRPKGRNNPSGAPFLVLGSGDQVVIQDGWVQGKSDYPFVVGGGARLAIKSKLAVPEVGSTGAWVKTRESGSVWIAGPNHFGGENGGKTLIEAGAAPDLTGASSQRFVVVDMPEIYCSGKPMIRFLDIPNLVSVRTPIGTTSGAHLYEFTNQIPASTLKAMGSLVRIRDDVEARSVFPFTTSSERAVAERYLAIREPVVVS